MISGHVNFIPQEEKIAWKRSSIPRGWVWYTNMAAVSLFWNTNMAAVTSCENAPYEGMMKRHWMQLPVKWCNDGCLATGEGTTEKISKLHNWNSEIFSAVPFPVAEQLLRINSGYIEGFSWVVFLFLFKNKEDTKLFPSRQGRLYNGMWQHNCENWKAIICNMIEGKKFKTQG